MAKIQINGRKKLIKQNFSVFDLLKKYKINSTKVAIELNGKILPKNKYNATKLKDQDIIEMVQFIGGG
mgnify:CR=1 FL=1